MNIRFSTPCSNFYVYLVLHNTLMLATSYRFTTVCWGLDMDSCENVLVHKNANGCRIYDPGSIR